MINLKSLWRDLLVITQNDPSDLDNNSFIIIFNLAIDEINNFHSSAFPEGKGVDYSYNGMNKKFNYILKLALLKNYFVINEEDTSTMRNNNEKLILGLTKLDYPSDFPIQFRIDKKRTVNSPLNQKELFYDDLEEIFVALTKDKKDEFVKENFWVDTGKEADDNLLQDFDLTKFDITLTYGDKNVEVFIKSKNKQIKDEFKKVVKIKFLNKV